METKPSEEYVNAIVEHYQKTYELTYDLWQQRNRTFLLLLVMIGVSTVLTFRVPEANSLLVDFVAKLVGITDPDRLKELRNGFPFGILQSILLIVVFYFMVNLYHRAVFVLRNYRYLAGLEKDIRQALGLPKGSTAFTRESTFYWSERSRMSGLVKWIYIAMLGLLLLAFLGGRIIQDLNSGNKLLALVELAIAIPTLAFYLEYARSSVGMDNADSIVGVDKRG